MATASRGCRLFASEMVTVLVCAVMRMEAVKLSWRQCYASCLSGSRPELRNVARRTCRTVRR